MQTITDTTKLAGNNHYLGNPHVKKDGVEEDWEPSKVQEYAKCMSNPTHFAKEHVKIINLNNRYLGMVRQWQEFMYESRESHSYLDSLPDFAALTESFGHVGMRIESPGDVEGALKEAFAMKDRLVFMDFITDQSENVYPMMMAGSGHNEMRLSDLCRDRELA